MIDRCVCGFVLLLLFCGMSYGYDVFLLLYEYLLRRVPVVGVGFWRFPICELLRSKYNRICAELDRHNCS